MRQNQNRKSIIALGIVLVLALWFILFLSFLRDGIPYTFYWGLLIGGILGLATCFYLFMTWDPVNLRPKNPKTRMADERILWTVPIGIVLGRILLQFVAKEIAYLIASCILAWFTLTVSFATIQGWRYRPK